MKKGQLVEGVVTRVDFPNKGIVMTDEGDRLTVKNVIEGQRISCVVKKTRKDKAQGLFREVLEKSPLEMTEAACPHNGICGGCAYQTLDYETQLKIKDGQMRRIFENVIPDFDNLFEGVIASPVQSHYRNKMEFSFGDAMKDGPLELGMHKRGSFYDIVTVTECQIIPEDMRLVLQATLEYFSERNITYFHKMRHEGYLRHLLVRKAVKTGEMIVDLVTSSDVSARKLSDNLGPDGEAVWENVTGIDETELLNGWRDALMELKYEGKLVGVLHTTNDRDGDVVEDQGTEVLYGQSYFFEELLGLKFKITPFSFFQTNSLGAEVLYSKARDYISQSLDGDLDKLNGKVLFDLYSGTGTIAQIMAPVADKVVGVEIVEEAVEAAKINAKENGLDNCEFLAGDVLKVIDDIQEKPDYIILDPPRDGINPKALKKIIDYGVENMVYISCKPTSLARDLEMLQECGYVVKKISCVDMFPGTVHCETVCLLSKLREAKHHVRVKLDMGSTE